MSVITAAIDREISSLEERLEALKQARKVLGSEVPGRPAGRPGRRRRKLSAAHKAAIGRRMKAAWKRRKSAKSN